MIREGDIPAILLTINIVKQTWDTYTYTCKYVGNNIIMKLA